MTAAAVVLAFIGATLIDGAGAAPVPDAIVVVQDGRIVAAGPRATTPVPASAERVDLSGRFLIPGLTDVHVDLRPETAHETLRQLLAYGVTTAKESGGFNADTRPLRRDIDSGAVPGPHLVTTGAIVDGSETATLEDVGDARTLVRRSLAFGADFIQIGPHVGEAALDAIVDEAEQHQLKVVGSTPTLFDPRLAVGKGLYGFEGGSPHADPDALARAFAGERVYFAPMMSDTALVMAAHRAGVPIVAAGTGPPGEGLHRDLARLVEAGLTPLQAIACAGASAAAALLQPGEFGVIAKGARADLVVLSANPADDIAKTRSIVAVYKDGRRVSGSLPRP